MAGEDRVLLFPSTRHAIRAERALKDAGMDFRTIPAPSRYTADCGVAIAYHGEEEERTLEVVRSSGVTFEGPLPLS